jgi:hypothetical protein
MLAAILIIVGLIISFSEKVHLFQRPVTFWRGCVILLLVGSAVTSFYKDKEDGKQKAADSGTIKTLNSQVDSLRKESRVAQKEYTDSIISYHNYTTGLLAKYGLKIDTLTNQIKETDTKNKKAIPPPIFELDPGNEIVLQDKIDNKYKLRLNFKSADAASTNFNITLYLITQLDNGTMEYQGMIQPLPHSQKMETNSSWGKAITYTPADVNNRLFKNLYLWMKGTYTDVGGNQALSIDQVYKFECETKITKVINEGSETIRSFVKRSDKSKKIPIEVN